MAADDNIFDADGKVRLIGLAGDADLPADVKVLDAGDSLVLSGPTEEAVESALKGFVRRGAKIISPVGLVGRRWVAACTVPQSPNDLDTTQTLNLSDEVRVNHSGGNLILTGPSAEAVEFSLTGFLSLGATVVSPVSQIGSSWVVMCTAPAAAAVANPTPESVAPGDGCRIEKFGLKRIIYGSSERAVQLRIGEMQKFGAELVGEIEQEGEEWVAICDIAGIDDSTFPW